MRPWAIGVGALALVGACGKQATVVLADVRGQGDNAKTSAFAAPGTFRVEYSWDCSGQITRGEKTATGFGYTLFHADDETLAAENPSEQFPGAQGKGVVDYAMLGYYYFSVNSGCNWRLKVVDTSRGGGKKSAASGPSSTPSAG